MFVSRQTRQATIGTAGGGLRNDRATSRVRPRYILDIFESRFRLGLCNNVGKQKTTRFAGVWSGLCDRGFGVSDEGVVELGGGSYAAMEGDLGEVLRPLAGFGRDLDCGDEGEELWDGVVFTPEVNCFQTAPGAVVFEVKFG